MYLYKFKIMNKQYLENKLEEGFSTNQIAKELEVIVLQIITIHLVQPGNINI